MSTINPGFGRLLAGFGGALLIGSLFLPWSESARGVSQSGWEALTVSDVLFLITGLLGLATAITGGRFGFFRPDVSMNGAADIVAVVAGIVLAWLILFDWPSGTSRQVGVYLALAGALAVMTGAGDFRITSVFPKLPGDERTN
jgi:hypothetical protein